MKDKELSMALKALSKVLADPNLESVQRKNLVDAQRELKKIHHSGKILRRRIGRASRLLCEAFLTTRLENLLLDR